MQDTLIMQCRDVRELADSFLTEQLLVETNHEVVRHLETCPDCRAEIAARRVMRDTLRVAFTRAEDLQPRPQFAAELTAKLNPRQSGVLSRRSLLQSWWALAAGAVLAAGGGLFVRDARVRSGLAALARDAAGDHQNCAVKFNLAERPIPLDEAGMRYGGPYAALAAFQFSGIDAELQMVERHACVYQGRRFAHVVFRYRGAIASLLVTDGTPPAAPELEAHDGALEVASLPAGRYVGFVVASLDRRQVLALAERFAQPLSTHLA